MRFNKLTTHLIMPFFKIQSKITAFDLCMFFRQFSTLISAGIPVLQSCDILAKCQEKKVFSELINMIKHDILAGKNLFYCLEKHPLYFSDLICRFIQIGEETGKLDSMLNLIANDLEKSQFLKQKIRQILFYPCLVVIFSLITTIGLLAFVIPSFAELFKNTSVQLPFITICIFYISAKLKIVLFLCLIILLAAIIFFRLKKIKLKTNLQKMASCLPFVKIYFDKIIIARFSSHLALAISAGMSLPTALIITANASGNIEFRKIIQQLHRKVSTGIELHKVLPTFSIFPLVMIQMVKIGEESGMLENMLNKFTDFTESEINQLTHHLNLILEPLIMLILGVLIGGLVIGMYLPIFKLGSAF